MNKYKDLKYNNDEHLKFNLRKLSEYPYNSDYLKNIKKIMGKTNPKYETYTPGDSQNFAKDLIDKLICESKDEDLGNESYCNNLENKSVKFNKFTQYQNFANEYNKKDRIEKLFQFAEISQKSPSKIYSFSIVLHIELLFPPEQNKLLSLKDLLEYKYPINGNKYNKLPDFPEILIISFTRGIVGKNVIKTKVSFTEELNLEPILIMI